MQAVRIIVPEVHDGLGGVHRAGDVVALPEEIARVFLDKKCAVVASDVDHAQAKALATLAADEKRATELKAGATARMRHFDDLPEGVRAELNETGAPVHLAAAVLLAEPETDDSEAISVDPEPVRRGAKRRRKEA